jgi:hypothetical protein
LFAGVLSIISLIISALRNAVDCDITLPDILLRRICPNEERLSEIDR